MGCRGSCVDGLAGVKATGGGSEQLCMHRESPVNSGMPLQKSNKNCMIAGICGGIAEWLGWDPTLVRVAYVIASIFSVAFPGIIVYLILWAIMPKPRGEDW